MNDTSSLENLKEIELDVIGYLNETLTQLDYLYEVTSLRDAIMEHGTSDSLLAYTADVNLLTDDKYDSIQRIDATIESIGSSIKEFILKLVNAIINFLKNTFKRFVKFDKDCDTIISEIRSNITNSVNYKWASHIHELEVMDLKPAVFEQLFITNGPNKCYIDTILNDVEATIKGKLSDVKLAIKMDKAIKDLAVLPDFILLKSHNLTTISDQNLVAQALLDSMVQAAPTSYVINTKGYTAYATPKEYVISLDDIDTKQLTKQLTDYLKRFEKLKKELTKLDLSNYPSVVSTTTLLSILIQQGIFRVNNYVTLICNNFKLMQKIK